MGARGAAAPAEAEVACGGRDVGLDGGQQRQHFSSASDGAVHGVGAGRCGRARSGTMRGIARMDRVTHRGTYDGAVGPGGGGGGYASVNSGSAPPTASGAMSATTTHAHGTNHRGANDAAVAGAEAPRPIARPIAIPRHARDDPLIGRRLARAPVDGGASPTSVAAVPTSEASVDDGPTGKRTSNQERRFNQIQKRSPKMKRLLSDVPKPSHARAPANGDGQCERPSARGARSARALRAHRARPRLGWSPSRVHRGRRRGCRRHLRVRADDRPRHVGGAAKGAERREAGTAPRLVRLVVVVVRSVLRRRRRRWGRTREKVMVPPVVRVVLPRVRARRSHLPHERRGADRRGGSKRRLRVLRRRHRRDPSTRRGRAQVRGGRPVRRLDRDGARVPRRLRRSSHAMRPRRARARRRGRRPKTRQHPKTGDDGDDDEDRAEGLRRRRQAVRVQRRRRRG